MQNGGIGAVPEQVEHPDDGLVVELADKVLVHAAFPLFVQEGKEDDALVYPLVGLEGKDVAVERVFEQQIAPLPHRFTDHDALEPVDLVYKAVGL